MIDTAVVVSALLFEQGRLTFIREAWTGGLLRPLTSKATATELLRVLGYPKFQLTSDEVATVLAAYLPFVATIVLEGDVDQLPRCSDQNDQMFIELAHVGEADILVTGDRALLDLNNKVTFEILKPAELEQRL